MSNRYILGLDPSGNYDEGKGITGWCLYDRETGKVCKFGVLDSRNFASRAQYWEAHILLIDEMLGYHPDVVCEDYLLYATTTEAQTNSRLETPRLIGVIEYECFMRGVKVHFQTAAQVKIRWSEKILVHKGLLTCNGNKYLLNGVVTQDHTRDALKHALHLQHLEQMKEVFFMTKKKEEVDINMIVMKLRADRKYILNEAPSPSLFTSLKERLADNQVVEYHFDFNERAYILTLE